MSALLEARKATYALLQAWPWPSGTPTFSWGPPTKTEDTNTPTGENVYLAQANLDADALTLGRSAYTETFTIRVVIDVWQDGDDEMVCEERADVLYEQVIRMFAAAASPGQPGSYLNGTVNTLGPWTSNRAVAPYGSGWRCQVTVEQDCTKNVMSSTSP